MSKIKIIGDPGSCHMGDFGRAKALTEVCAYSGCDAIKWQLFEGAEIGPQNIALPYKWLPKLAYFGKELGMEVLASVWDRRGLTALLDCGCSSVKFAYSQNENDDLIFDTLVEKFSTKYISCDCNTGVEDGFTGLYCVPEYPVKSILDFEGIFPRFDGFSSHCLGINQDVGAMMAGAKIIEKHFQLDDPSHCPDGSFALRPGDLKRLCQARDKMEAE